MAQKESAFRGNSSAHKTDQEQHLQRQQQQQQQKIELEIELSRNKNLWSGHLSQDGQLLFVFCTLPVPELPTLLSVL